MRAAGRVVLITGAAQGIGAAIAQAFLAAGARAVIGVDQRPIAEAPGLHPFQFDIADHAAFTRCVETVAATLGPVEILVNNAAISPYADLFEATLEDWIRTQQVNVEAAWWAAKLVAPGMRTAGWGRIINISSVQALAVEARVGAYAASKGALLSLTRSLAVELAPHGILANAILPGCIHTPMSIVDGVDETTTENFRAWYIEQRKIPLARPGQPEEIARVAVFLGSEDCSYITGQAVVVDGGLSITF